MAGSRVHFGASALVLGAVLALPGAASAQQKQVTFSKDVAPILQAKCQSCHEPGSIGPMSLVTYQDARPWARSIKQRVETRQMPPWHIDRSVGVTKFKNDMSLTRRAGRDHRRRGSIGGALEGNPADFKAQPVAKDLFWQGERDGYGPPDLVIKSRRCRRCLRSRRTSGGVRSATIPITEPRWVKMVEIRPTNLQCAQDPASLDRLSRPQPGQRGRRQSGRAGGAVACRPPARPYQSAADLVNRRPQLMEWAIGKGYDRFMEGTGKMIMPGEKISWDQHIHAVGEEITGGSEIGLWLYKKGEEPKKRSYLVGFTGLKNGSGGARHSAELGSLHGRLQRAEGEHHHHELPAALPPARQGDAGRGAVPGWAHPDASAT